MSIDLGHTIIRARDKHRSARFLADILGLQVGTATPPFLPIRTGNGVTLDVVSCAPETITSQHYEVTERRNRASAATVGGGSGELYAGIHRELFEDVP
ncbi:MAG: hypothetical protein QOC94_3166 [Actinoplanes sp.]|nr:hypothetical protein [Actinoplanes sp.]